MAKKMTSKGSDEVKKLGETGMSGFKMPSANSSDSKEHALAQWYADQSGNMKRGELSADKCKMMSMFPDLKTDMKCDKNGELLKKRMIAADKANKALDEMSSFFDKHNFTTDERDLFFNAAMSCARFILSDDEYPQMESKLMFYLCRENKNAQKDIRKHITGCVHFAEAVALDASVETAN